MTMKKLLKRYPLVGTERCGKKGKRVREYVIFVAPVDKKERVA